MLKISRNQGIFLIFLVILCVSGICFAEGEHQEGHKGGLFSPNPGMMIWTIITFLLVLTILRATAWKPLMQSLEEREKAIRDALEGAKKARDEAEQLLKQHQEKLTNAQAEVKAIIQEAQKAAQGLKDALIKEATEETQRIRSRSENEIKLAKEKAIQEIFAVAADASIAISTKLIQKSLDKNEQNKIINETLNQFKNTQLRN